MKKLFSVFFLSGVLLVMGAGCVSNQVDELSNTSEQKVMVAATIFPLYDIVREVGGDYVNTQVILKPGASPHTFEVTPQLVKDVQETQVFFAIGHGLDGWIDQLAKSVSDAEIVQVDSGVSIRETVEEDQEEGVEEEAEDHGPTDPHYWLDPMQAIEIARTVSAKLAELDPQHASEYNNNTNRFAKDLLQKDLEWKEKLSQIKTKEVITFHDSFYYFADHFGLEVVATFEPFPGKQPTPQYLAQIQEEVKEHGIDTLFLEPQLSQSAIQAFATDVDAEIGILDPLGGIEERTTYIDLIEYNVNTLAQVLAK